MGFGKRRRQSTETITLTTKEEGIKLETQKKVHRNGQESNKKSVLPREHEIIKFSEERDSVAVNDFREAMEVVAEKMKEEIKDILPLGGDKIEKEEIIPFVKPENQKKKRSGDKTPNDLFITGKNVIANDFRAIVKKKGLQINNVLAEILHDWNTKNYQSL